MSPYQIKQALSRPPVFGDVEQINALKVLRQADAENEAKRAEGKKEYKVTVEYTFSETVTVWAEDETEAKSAAREAIDIEDGEYEYFVRENTL